MRPLKRVALGAVVVAVTVQGAVAQVPVTDGARISEEEKTARCMLRARTYKANAVSPTKGIKGSVVAPGSAGSLTYAGQGNVLGAGPTEGPIGGVDIGSLIGGAMGAIGSLSGKNHAEAYQAISAVSAAIESNTQVLNSSGQQIGSSDAAQGAWDQNTGIRLGSAGVWGQAIQAGTVRVQLQNDKLIRQTEEASNAAKVMQYDRSRARLVDDPAHTHTYAQ